MADLNIWKPWYARVPGACVVLVAFAAMLVLFAPTAAFAAAYWLSSLGFGLMRRK